MPSLTRRSFLRLMPAAGALVAGWPARAEEPPAAPERVPDRFPQPEPELAEQVVGAAHTRLDLLRPLVEAQPALANAAIDWGFGDWETAIGACSHTGRRDIAESLGDADLRDRNEPLAEAERAALLGTYSWGKAESERWVVAASRSGISVARAGGPARPLLHQGGRQFHPGGSPRTSVRFEPPSGPPERLIVEHGGRRVRSERVPD